MMKSILIILLITQIILACHPSCNCSLESDKVCLSCKDENSIMDSNQRSCYCKSGFYTYQLQPTFQCKQYINANNSGEDNSIIMDSCKEEIGIKLKSVLVITNCHYETVGNNNYVVSEVSLDTHQVSFNPVCLNDFKTKVQYQPAGQNINIKEDLKYVDLDGSYITDKGQGSKILQIPLIDIFKLAYTQQINAEQISQVVKLRILIGHEDRYLRAHNWDLTVYTNRNQVQVFNINIDMERTSGCQSGQDCIVVADLDTIGKVYEDNTFTVEKTDLSNYKVGDIFYAKITFVDPTYKKRLIYQNLYYKNSDNQVFEYSSITQRQWVGDGLTIQLPLIEPTEQAKIQVSMLIDEGRLRRTLSSTTFRNPQMSFTLVVTKTQKQSENVQANNNNNNENTFSSQIGFMLLQCFILLLLN